MIIGITGNSGSGKTTLSNLLKKEYDASLINADEIVKEVSEPGCIYYNEIINIFGEEILLQNRKIDKQKLAELIFNDSNKRKELNKITFKYIVEEIKNRIDLSNKSVNIIDAPLLIESNLNRICDVVVSVITNEDTKLNRICKRDNLSKDEALKRLNSQPNNDFYTINSNLVIINNENNNLEEQLEGIKEILDSNMIKSKEIVIIQNKDCRIMQFKKLLEYDERLIHAFTLKPLDFGSNDTYEKTKEKVNDNYKLICNMLKLDSKNIVRPFQTHTNNIKEVKDEMGVFNKKFINIDGLVTKENNIILSLVFADCTPIYLFDKNKNIIGNIHSGWQGTVKKISKESIKFMKEKFNCNPKDIICVIGPTIGKCHFEVKKDVRDLFYDTFKYMKDIDDIIKYNSNTDSYFIDTIKINKGLLKEEGIVESNIIDSNACTVCNYNLIHSHRKEGINAGRCTSMICLK